MKRLFLALPVPDTIHEELERLRIGLPGARWAQNLHITLRFFGDTTQEQQSAIEEQLAELDFPAPAIRLGRPGVLVHPRQTILYLQVQPDEAIRALKSEVDALLRPAGFRMERRYFPHCTLARISGKQSRYLQQYVLQFEHFQTSSYTADELVLFSSILQRTGALHISEECYKLSPV